MEKAAVRAFLTLLGSKVGDAEGEALRVSKICRNTKLLMEAICTRINRGQAFVPKEL